MTSKPHSTFTRLDAIRAAWVDAEVEPVFITAQMDMAYLFEQLATVQRELQAMKDADAERILTLDAINERESGIQEQLESLRDELERIANDPARALSLYERGIVPNPATSGNMGGLLHQERADHLRRAREASDPASRPNVSEGTQERSSHTSSVGRGMVRDAEGSVPSETSDPASVPVTGVTPDTSRGVPEGNDGSAGTGTSNQDSGPK